MTALIFNRTDLYEPVITGAKPGGLNIKNDECAVKGHFPVAGNRVYRVIDIIALHTVEHLYASLLSGCHRLGKSLNNAVIRDGDSFVPPFCGAVYKLLRARDTVKLRHARVHMKLNSFFGCGVFLKDLLYTRDGIGVDNKGFHVAVKFHMTSYQQGYPVLELLAELCAVFI